MRKVKDMLSLEGRVAVITGGAGILGTKHAEALAEMGAKVIMLDKNKEAGEKSKEHIYKELEKEVYFKEVDLLKKQEIKDVFSSIKEEFKDIDILVNNAATKSENFFEPFETFSLEEWKEVMAVNVDAMFLCAQEAGKHMKKQGNGSIINISSIYGIVAPDQSIYEGSEYLGQAINTPAIYSASKGAVVMLTKYLATYWGKDGIRTNSITPGGVFSGQNDTFTSNYAKKCPMGRMAKQDELKGAIVYLASDASSYVNGHNLVVDGGWSVW